MASSQVSSKSLAGKAASVVMAVAVAAVLSIGVYAAPSEAHAADDLAAAQPTGQLAPQASVASTAAKDAKAVIKKAKATSGTAKAKLKRIYTYIAKDKSFNGTYQFESVLYFYGKYGVKYYTPATSGMYTYVAKNYKKHAVDMFNEKKGSCFNYAALLGIASKQALGSKGTVKIACGTSKHNGEAVNHAWVEVTLNKKTYVYDPQAGNNYSKKVGKATSFGTFCGTLKTNSALKANYNKYKGVHYTTVKM